MIRISCIDVKNYLIRLKSIKLFLKKINLHIYLKISEWVSKVTQIITKI